LSRFVGRVPPRSPILANGAIALDSIYKVPFVGQGAPIGAPESGGAPATAVQGGPPPGKPPGCGGPEQIFFMLGMLVLFYFLLIRPQQKKMKQHKQMTESLKRGDSVITSGGIFGRITAVEGNILTVEIAKGTNIRILKSSVGGIANPETEDKLAQNPQPGPNP